MTRLFEFQPQEGKPTLLAFGGGKGGIGKSLLSANFGAALAQAGYKVLVVDLDLGDANLHTLMGLAEPAVTLSDFVTRKTAKLDDVIVSTPVPGLKILPAARDDLDAPLLKATQRDKLLRHLKKAPFDFILLDLGAGSSANTLDFFHAADVGILVTTAEKPAVENVYRFVKALIERQIKKIIPEDHANLRERVRKGEPLSRLLLQTTPDLPAELHEILRGLLAPLRLFMIANQVRRDSDQRLAHQMAACARKYFPLHLEALGYVPYDPAVFDITAAGQFLSVAQPHSPAIQAIGNLARQFLRLTVDPPRDVMQEIGHPWAAQNPYVFLGVAPHAPGAEIEMATRKMDALLAPGALATHSLFNFDEIQELLKLAHKFRDDLLSTPSRTALDARLERELAQVLSGGNAATMTDAKPAAAPPVNPEPAATPSSTLSEPHAPPRPPPQAGDTPVLVPAVPATTSIHPAGAPLGSIFSGRVLKATREMHGLTLDDVARETKIRRWYFECIEEERIADLPAPVYLKGFLRQFAGILKLDGDKVVADYMLRIAPPAPVAK